MGIRRGSISTPIVADGLVFNMDAANRASYVPDATTAYNTLDLTQSGSLQDTGMYSSDNKGIFAFDGIDDYITVTNFTTNGNDLTISMWIKAVNLGGGDPNGCFLYGSTSNFVYYNLNETIYARINGVDAYVSVGPGGHVPVIPQIFGTGNFHHIVITKSGSTVTWWFDGISYTNSGTGTTGGFTLNHIGSYGGTLYFLDGNIANAQIYNRALSSNEVLHNYNALKGRFS